MEARSYILPICYHLTSQTTLKHISTNFSELWKSCNLLMGKFKPVLLHRCKNCYGSKMSCLQHISMQTLQWIQISIMNTIYLFMFRGIHLPAFLINKNLSNTAVSLSRNGHSFLNVKNNELQLKQQHLDLNRSFIVWNNIRTRYGSKYQAHRGIRIGAIYMYH